MDSQIVLHHGTDETENEIIDTNKGTASSFTCSIVMRSIKRDEMGRCDPSKYLTLSEDSNYKGTPRGCKQKCLSDIWASIQKLRIINEGNKSAYHHCQRGSQKKNFQSYMP